MPFRDSGPGASSGTLAIFRHHVAFGTRKAKQANMDTSWPCWSFRRGWHPAERGVTRDKQSGAKGQHYWKPGQHGLRGHQDTSLSLSIHKGAVAIPTQHPVPPSQKELEELRKVTVFRFLNKAQRFVTSCFLLKECSLEKCDLLPHIQKRAVWITA